MSVSIKSTPVIICDAQGNILSASDAICALLQYRRNELQGKNYYSTLRSDHYPEQFFANIAEVIRREGVWQGDIRSSAKDGSSVWMNVTVVPMPDVSDELPKFLVLYSPRPEVKPMPDESADAEELQYRLAQERGYADAVLDSLPGVFYHYDEHLRLRRWNKNLQQITGYSDEELDGIDPLSFFAPEQREKVALGFRNVFEHGGGAVEADYLLKDGRRIPYLFTGVRFEYNGKNGFVGTGTDITKRKQREEKQRKESAILQALLDAAPDGILVVDQNGRKTFQSRRMSEIWKIPPDIFDNVDDSQQLAYLTNKVKHRKEFSSKVEWLYAHPDEVSADEIELLDGTILERSTMPIREPSGNYQGRVWAFRDITERKIAAQRVLFLATHDELTGLPNFGNFQDEIREAREDAIRNGKLLGVLGIDLDRFSVLNDAYGYSFGNEVLQAVSERLRWAIRATDTLARFGGNEFMVLVPGLQKSREAEDVARRVLAIFEQPFVIREREVHLTASVGVSVFPEDGESVETLIWNVDMALRRAKELGRNTYQFFTREMGERALERVELETALHNAVSSGQLHLAYQPKVSLHTGKIVGAEALLRWNHPTLGPVSPATFIPVAEDSGLIVPIGDWVLRAVCQQIKNWTATGLSPVPVAVNLSVRQFLQQDVVAWATDVLCESSVPPESIELEITESLISQDVDNVVDAVKRLKEIGVHVSIDDFGTGYSNLNYLKQFQADVLKIDKSFVANMLDDPHDAAIISAAVSLAHGLGLKALAEGVETVEHCYALRAAGCDQIQGFYFSRPVPAEEFERMLREEKPLEW